MKILIFLAILPCFWAADDSHIVCPDKSTCNIGETCCKNSDKYNCCDLEVHEKENKKLIPASYFQKELKILDKEVNGNCSGKLCSKDLCCELDFGTCCANSTSCCPKDYHCCGASTEVWCCKTKQRCADSFMYCIAGASSLSSVFLTLIMMLIIVVSLKHF